MVDTISPSQRSWTMSRIRSIDTMPEMVVRSFLHRYGFRFRLHVKKLPGHPDIVLPKYKTVIEVRGCFWHQHKGCKVAHVPASNTSFWKKKFLRNIERDKKNEAALKKLGWRVIIVWECRIKQTGYLHRLAKSISGSHHPLIQKHI